MEEIGSLVWGSWLVCKEDGGFYIAKDGSCFEVVLEEVNFGTWGFDTKARC